MTTIINDGRIQTTPKLHKFRINTYVRFTSQEMGAIIKLRRKLGLTQPEFLRKILLGVLEDEKQ